jgi:hypothetical protein
MHVVHLDAHHNNTNICFGACHSQISPVNIVYKCSRASHVTLHVKLVRMVQYMVCTNYIRFNVNLLLWATVQARRSQSHPKPGQSQGFQAKLGWNNTNFKPHLRFLSSCAPHLPTHFDIRKGISLHCCSAILLSRLVPGM